MIMCLCASLGDWLCFFGWLCAWLGAWLGWFIYTLLYNWFCDWLVLVAWLIELFGCLVMLDWVFDFVIDWALAKVFWYIIFYSSVWFVGLVFHREQSVSWVETSQLVLKVLLKVSSAYALLYTKQRRGPNLSLECSVCYKWYFPKNRTEPECISLLWHQRGLWHCRIISRGITVAKETWRRVSGGINAKLAPQVCSSLSRVLRSHLVKVWHLARGGVMIPG